MGYPPQAMKIFDTFIFGGHGVELDLLECRLIELDQSLVYRHVIAEATMDHQGRPKQLVFPHHLDRFSPWHDKIVYVSTGDLPGPSPWTRIDAQRERLHQGLSLAGPEDIILHSDLDEIMTPEGIREAAGHPEGIRFSQRCAVFAVDWQLPWPWELPVAMRADSVGSFTALRGDRGYKQPLPLTSVGAGWHLSWLGGPSAIKAKMDAYCHNEMDAYITRGLAEGQFYERGIFWGHGGGDTQLLAVDVDDSWPRWIYERKCPSTWFRPR